MQLSDERISLFPLGEADLQICLDIFTSKELMQHVSDPLTEKEATDVFEVRSKPWDAKTSNWLALVITDKNVNEQAGWTSLRITDQKAKTAEIGFTLKSQFHGQGIASRALKMLKNHAFNELSLNKLAAICTVENIGSYTVLEKAGFSREGCLKQDVLIDGQYKDCYIYGLCRSDLN